MSVRRVVEVETDLGVFLSKGKHVGQVCIWSLDWLKVHRDACNQWDDGLHQRRATSVR